MPARLRAAVFGSERLLDKDLPLLAGVLARNVARRFRLDGRKGSLIEGQDADFTLVAPAAERKISADELWTRHRLSAYVGRRSRVRVTHTFVRGCAAWAEAGWPARHRRVSLSGLALPDAGFLTTDCTDELRMENLKTILYKR